MPIFVCEHCVSMVENGAADNPPAEPLNRLTGEWINDYSGPFPVTGEISECPGCGATLPAGSELFPICPDPEVIATVDLSIQTAEDGARESIALLSSIILEPQYVATGGACDWALEARDFQSDDFQTLVDFLYEGEGHLYDVTGLHAYAYAEGYSGTYFVERIYS